MEIASVSKAEVGDRVLWGVGQKWLTPCSYRNEGWCERRRNKNIV